MEQDLFSVWDYAEMINCQPRTRAYAAALKRHITPGCTLIDVGAGTGFFSLLACKYGAGHVIAIEPNDEIQFAKSSAKQNGYEDKITFFKGFSQDFEPKVKADVIISDLRGVLPLYKMHIPAIIDMRERLLSDQGVLLPHQDTIKVALVRDNEKYKIYESIIRPNEYGIDLSASHQALINSPRAFFSQPEHLTTEPQIFTELNYRIITSPDVSKTLNFPVNKEGLSHGLIMWFDAQIDAGLGFSNAPNQLDRQYRSQFLPFKEPITLCTSDRVTVELSAKLIAGNYVWSWRTEVFEDAAKNPKSVFKQSTFFAGLFKTSAV